MMRSQERIPISDITDDLVFLQNGSVTAVLKTSAVNFGLLADMEQYSIIESFAGLLNSLSFPIQIVIRSERMDVSSYLLTLDDALVKQTNPLLRNMIIKYRQFVETMIKENDVLDKQFYVCVTVSPLELGVLPSKKEEKIQKANTLLIPRLDHLIRQLSRTGLKAFQLTTDELVEVFYEIYNESSVENYSHAVTTPQATTTPSLPTSQQQPAMAMPSDTPAQPTTTVPSPVPTPRLQNFTIPRPQTVMQQAPVMTQPPAQPRPTMQQQAPQMPRMPYLPSTANLAHPFIVEELKDEYGP